LQIAGCRLQIVFVRKCIFSFINSFYASLPEDVGCQADRIFDFQFAICNPQLGTMTPRVLIIAHDVVGTTMAGPGIRAWEMARVLAAQQPVTLIAPRPIDAEAPNVATGSYGVGEAATLRPWLDGADVVVANGLVLQGHPELAETALPLALDLYDPTPLEHMLLLRDEPAAVREEQGRRDAALLQQQLLRADCVLCATERQRDLYLGALTALGGLRPDVVDADPLLRHLLRVVPFGLPSDPPPPPQPALRGVLPHIDADSLVVLWSGGLWDWMDPLTLIRAVAALRPELPQVRLVFLAGAHPGLARPSAMVARARSLASDLGLLDQHVVFYEDWVPYKRRADFVYDADVVAYLHGAHLESAYAAVRSRFLDHVWVGRASLVSAGDAASELVARHDLGRVVPSGDVPAVATALRELLSDAALRQACAARAQALASDYTWERAVAPLAEFCRRPARRQGAQPEVFLMATDTQASHPADAAPISDDADTRNAQLARLDALWQVEPRPLGSALPLVAQAKQAANSLTRWYVQGIVEQQNAFNAALVQALQTIADADDRRHSVAVGSADAAQQTVAQLHQSILRVERQLAHQQEWMANVTTSLQSLQRQIYELSGQLAPLHQHVADIEQHLLDIDDAQTRLALGVVNGKTAVGEEAQ
jgi:glycosyltransferase involved in cell wall biosynthesis